MGYLEPIYLNEKMLMNCAAYILKGVSLETQHAETDKVTKSANLQIGLKLLSDLISPISAGAEVDSLRETTTKTARRFTVGGLHMSLVDELEKQKILHKGERRDEHLASGDFLEIDAILRPIDLFSIIEVLKLATPIGAQFFTHFGERLNPTFFDKKLVGKLPAYEQLLVATLNKLEEDYLSSRQLEMIMIDPVSGKEIGVVDLDVQDDDASAVKARLTDGKFKVIGKVTRSYSEDEELSLVQRSVLSSAVEIVDRIADMGGEAQAFRTKASDGKALVQKVCQLSIDGPAIRLTAMSVCI